MNRYGKNEARRFNFIDVLIILLVLLMVAGVIFRAQLISFFGDGERRRECYIEFRADAVPKEVVGYIKTGDVYTWQEKNVLFGKLRQARISPSIVYLPNSDGTYRTATDPNSYAVDGTIHTDVLYDGGCYVEGVAFLAPGMVLTIYSEEAEFKVTVLSITYEPAMS